MFTACLVAIVRGRTAESLPSEHVALAAAAALCWALNIPPTIALAASQSGYDNANCREQKSHSTGSAYRCWAAHLHQHENFPIFAAGMWSAVQQGLAQPVVASLAWSWVALRLGYALAYVSGHDGLRTFVWFCSWCTAMALYAGVWLGLE